ncbi:ferrochelatase, partial [Tanacetum coccineum]
GVLLLNLGGPETLNDVQPFLYNLFADPDIIRLPRLFRFLQRPLAKLISTLRAPKSKEGYASIGGGSPLRKITDEQADALKMALEAKEVPANVYVAMRYWYPFTEEAVQLYWDEMPSASNKFALDMQFLAYFCITQAVKSKAVGDAKIVARAPIAVTVRSTIRRLREQTELDLMVSLSIVIAKPL